VPRATARAVATSLALAIPVVAGVGSMLSAGNVVPASKAGRFVTPIGADTLKPSSCAGITLTTVASGINGTTANELVLGTAAANTMSGGGGNDCVLGGGGNDAITGGSGTDVCIGGPGIDTFTTCETQIQ
jgi:hypothetical protein